MKDRQTMALKPKIGVHKGHTWTHKNTGIVKTCNYDKAVLNAWL